MEIVGQLLVLLHLVGFAALLGGLLVQLRDSEPDVNGAMLHGVWLSLATGAGLVGLLLVDQQRLPYASLSVKMGLTLLLVLLVSKNRKYRSIPRGLWGLLCVLTLLTLGVSVLWR